MTPRQKTVDKKSPTYARRISLDDKQHMYVNQMTNWQRNQWAIAGYPTHTAAFAGMEKPKQ